MRDQALKCLALIPSPQLSVGGRDIGLTGRTAWGSNKDARDEGSYIHIYIYLYIYILPIYINPNLLDKRHHHYHHVGVQMVINVGKALKKVDRTFLQDWVRLYICMYVCIYIYEYMYVYMYVCMQIYIYM
jgi:hypothetical protein